MKLKKQYVTELFKLAGKGHDQISELTGKESVTSFAYIRIGAVSKLSCSTPEVMRISSVWQELKSTLTHLPSRKEDNQSTRHDGKTKRHNFHYSNMWLTHFKKNLSNLLFSYLIQCKWHATVLLWKFKICMSFPLCRPPANAFFFRSQLSLTCFGRKTTSLGSDNIYDLIPPKTLSLKKNH